MAWAGQPSPWRARVSATLTAFAIHAAEVDRALISALESLGGGGEDEDD